jgi:phospholipid/cholesterol/gamma-HCH transport system substrate-binding protein
VLFNGIRVGEVTSLDLDRNRPRQVMATVMVDRRTPIMSDTTVNIEVQGLMGSPAIALRGGAGGAAPLSATSGQIPLIVAPPEAGQDMLSAAREALQRVNAVLAENSEPLRSAIAHVNTFAAALARNSDRLDVIVDGLVKMTGGGKKPTPQVFDLAAPRAFPGGLTIPDWQLVVLEPTTVISLDTQRIRVPSEPDAEAQWADTIPKLIQARMVQSFENAGFLKVVRPIDGIASDRQLSIDIRTFRASDASTAQVELGAKLIGSDGKIIEANIFRASEPIKGQDAAAVAGAIEAAFGRVATEIVVWALSK